VNADDLSRRRRDGRVFAQWLSRPGIAGIYARVSDWNAAWNRGIVADDLGDREAGGSIC
jgi:hypothetical protein